MKNTHKKSKDEQVREQYKLNLISHKATIEINNKQLKKLTNRKIKAREMYLDDDDFLKEDYKIIIDKADAEIASLKNKNIKLNEEIIVFENSLNGKIEHFSENLEVFKNEIKDILHKVTVDKDRVLIDIFGSRQYDLHKPSSAKLGWAKRNEMKGIKTVLELPLRHPIEDDELDQMTQDYLQNKSGNQD
ncbi:hypothetical protein [Formosa algae]|uniref:hypothetical protein n=1 Tax=Formosa algae TaxID=225843 RepID=UPI000CCF0EAA|nr:hypothetical protein [Formosa algae]PNW28944.1 hypothetical protein BKP44_06800 [Formosa algae]